MYNLISAHCLHRRTLSMSFACCPHMCTSSTCHLHIIYLLLPLQLDSSPRNSKTQKVKETRLISQKVK